MFNTFSLFLYLCTMKINLLALFLFLSVNLMASDTSSIKGYVLLQGNYTSGNYNTYTIGSKFDIRYNSGNSIFEIFTSFKYTENGYIREISNPQRDSFVLKENEKYDVISYAYIHNRFKFIMLSEQEQSYLRKIKSRYNLGVGIGYKFIATKNMYFEISEVLLPEQINYTISNDDITSIRYSTRAKFIYNKKPICISNISLFQPNIWNSKGVDYSENLNIRNSSTFDVSIIKDLSLGLSDDYIMQSYVHKIFPNKRSYDNTLTFYLKLNF